MYICIYIVQHYATSTYDFLSAGLQQHQLHPECISAAAAHPADLPHPEPTLPTRHRGRSTDSALTLPVQLPASVSIVVQ